MYINDELMQKKNHIHNSHKIKYLAIIYLKNCTLKIIKYWFSWTFHISSFRDELEETRIVRVGQGHITISRTCEHALLQVEPLKHK